MPPWHRRVGSTRHHKGGFAGFGAEVSTLDASKRRCLLAPRVGSTQPPRGRRCLVRRRGVRHLDASKRRCLRGAFDEWVRRSHHKGGVAWVRRRGVRPSTPPNADASVDATSGFDAATTRRRCLGSAPRVHPSTPPNADTSVASTSGFGVVDPKVTKPEPGTGVMSTSVSARMATVFLILRKPVPWRKRRMASCGLGAPLPRGAPWPDPYLSGWPAGIRSASTSSGHFLPSGFEHIAHRHRVLHSTCRLKHLCAV